MHSLPLALFCVNSLYPWLCNPNGKMFRDPNASAKFLRMAKEEEGRQRRIGRMSRQSTGSLDHVK